MYPILLSFSTHFPILFINNSSIQNILSQDNLSQNKILLIFPITNAGLFFCMLCHPFPEIVSLLQTIATILRTTVCRATFPKNLLFFRWEKCLTNHFFFVMMVMYMHDFIEHFNR